MRNAEIRTLHRTTTVLALLNTEKRPPSFSLEVVLLLLGLASPPLKKTLGDEEVNGLIQAANN